MLRVLFVCIGNSIRSQMAEAFARLYGSDVIEPQSAGLAPASIVQPFTHSTLAEKNIRLEKATAKGLDKIPPESFDLVVNISGRPLPTTLRLPVLEWRVADPIGQSEEQYRIARDEIEHLVMRLILELRIGAFKMPVPV